jgi:hypothetical protein
MSISENERHETKEKSEFSHSLSATRSSTLRNSLQPQRTAAFLAAAQRVFRVLFGDPFAAFARLAIWTCLQSALSGRSLRLVPVAAMRDKPARCICSEHCYDTPVETATELRQCSTIPRNRPFTERQMARFQSGRSLRQRPMSHMADLTAVHLAGLTSSEIMFRQEAASWACRRCSADCCLSNAGEFRRRPFAPPNPAAYRVLRRSRKAARQSHMT